MAKHEDLKVFISGRESRCEECGETLGRGGWITLAGERGALCLSCGDLDHLEFLPSGDAALTRRVRKHSKLVAVVLKFSKARKRYERQGLLVEAEAIERAEAECLDDEDARARQRERAALCRAELDRDYVALFAARIRELFPTCPASEETVIAEHACLKHSGRVGRTAAAKALDEQAVRLAVIARIRHAHTDYDRLLSRGVDRDVARSEVNPLVRTLLSSWEEGVAPSAEHSDD